MSDGLRLAFGLVAAAGFLMDQGVSAQTGAPEDKTLSPYFLIKSDGEEGIEQFPLKKTSARIDVAGVIADVRITQVYSNDGSQPIEALYVFPASTRAAVYGMKMTIGDRVRIAKIKKKAEARKTYEQAKSEGKGASLLEQKRPNVFKMSVANIMPGDRVKVELSYTELLVPQDGVYELVYPAVVGPRYSTSKKAAAPAGEVRTANPHLKPKDHRLPYAFDVSVGLDTGIPIREISSPSHKIDIDYQGDTHAEIRLAGSRKPDGNRDYVLRYKLRGEEIETGLLLYEGRDENFFLLMMEPPARVKTEQLPPREYIFIVDVSGSMWGFPLETAKLLLVNLIGNLTPRDTFNLLLFAGGSALWKAESQKATPENISRAVTFIDQQQGGGGTELLPALKRALDLPFPEGRSRTMIIVTDGYVNVEPQVFKLIRDKIGEANFFPFGIGSGVNRHLIEGMARTGAGEPFVVLNESEAMTKAARFRQYVEAPVLTGIKVDFSGLNVYDVEPQGVPDIFSDRPLIIYGKWRGDLSGEINVTGSYGGGVYTQSIDLSGIKPKGSNSALRYLWARKRIELLGDFRDLAGKSDLKKEITGLGLKYNLLTKFTSFVAVDEVARNPEGSAKEVKEPLPLPEGVSKYTLSEVPSVPEPETYAFMVILLMFVVFLSSTWRSNLNFSPVVGSSGYKSRDGLANSGCSEEFEADTLPKARWVPDRVSAGRKMAMDGHFPTFLTRA